MWGETHFLASPRFPELGVTGVAGPAGALSLELVNITGALCSSLGLRIFLQGSIEMSLLSRGRWVIIFQRKPWGWAGSLRSGLEALECCRAWGQALQQGCGLQLHLHVGILQSLS